MTVFYVCYGSNLSETRFRQYLNDYKTPLESYRVNLARDVYYAGGSSRWGGGIAFLDADRFTAKKVYRAYALSKPQFESLFSDENGWYRDPLPWDQIHENENTYLQSCLYNRIINLGTIHGVPALTFTNEDSAEEAARYNWLSEPGPKYTSVINAGRAETRRLPYRDIVGSTR